MEEISITYAIPYIVLALIFMFLSAREYFKPENLNYGILAALVFLLFFGLRGFVGWDYANYYPSYVDDTKSLFSSGSILDKINNLEWDTGFSVYLIICKTFFPNYHVFIFISTLIDVVLLFLFFKQYSFNISLSFLLFITFSITLEIDLLRNVKAIVLCLIAIPYLIDRKPIQFFMLTLVAATFHFSAFLFLPAYFFIHKKMSQWLLWTLFALGNAIYLLSNMNIFETIFPYLKFLPMTFFDRGEIYINSGSFDIQYGLSLGFIERTITWLLIIFTYKRIVGKWQWAAVFLNFTVIYLMSFLLLSSISVLLSRISLLFSFGYWIIFPLFIDYFKNNVKVYFYYGIIIYLFIYCLLRTSMLNSIMNKYENVIFNHSTYEEKMSETSGARENQNNVLDL